MKKSIIKVLSVVLVVVITLTSTPLSGLVGLELPDWLDFSITSKAAETSGTCGQNVYWSFDETTGTLTISGTGAMYDYFLSSIHRRPWESYDYRIKTVVIEDGVTTIGHHAFFRFGSLTSVTIPDSVTSIGGSVFSFCDSLTNITVDSNNQYYSSDEYGALFNKDKTTLIKYPIGNTRLNYTIPDGVTTIGDSAFSGCESLTSITIPNSVTTIGDSAFSGCESLTSITIPNSVTTIGDDAFYNCTGLKELTMPASAKIYNSNGTFYNCTNIEKITLTKGIGVMQNYDTSSSSYVTNTYYGYTPWYISRNKCTEIIIEDGVTSIGKYAFNNCTNLTNVTIPDSVTTIGSSAFSGCTSLTCITIPDSVTSIGDDAFYNCTSLTSVTVNINNQYYSNDEYGVLFNKDKTTLIKYPTGNSRTSYSIPNGVTTIGDSAFSGCEILTSITIPNSVTTIGDSAFWGCTSLTSVTIPDSVTSIGSSAFYKCTSLTNVTISNSVTSIGSSAFSYCTSLTNITVDSNNQYYSSDEYGVLFNKEKTTLVQYPLGKTETGYTIPDSITTIGERSFYGCTSLASVIIPDSITTIGDWSFYGCTSLASVTIPDSVISIGYSAFRDCYSLKDLTIGCCVKDINGFAFNYCSSLTSIIIPDSVTYIGDAAFENCDSITSIIIPDGVTRINSFALAECDLLTNITIPNSVTYIGWHAFSRCPRLTSIIIPDSVTYIDSSAFYDCTNLTSIAFGKNLETIISYAFNGCVSLTDVYYSGTANQWNSISIDEWYNESLLNATIHFCETKEKEPTCITSGYIKFTCSSCGKTFTKYLETKEHKAGEWQITKEPDCTKVGTKKQKCINCNTIIKTEEIPATGHNYTLTVTSPTCTENGYTTYICSCGYSCVNDYVESIGHSYDNGVVTLEPTCIDTGIKVFTCAVCDDTYNEDVEAVGHDIITDEAVSPDCTNTGLTAGEHCSRCDYKVEQTVIEALGHKYDTVITVPTCTDRGYTKYTCSVCGDTYTSDFVDALGHTDGETVEENYVAPTCTETGSKDNVTYCTVCDAETSRKEIIIDATGHTEEEIPAVAPTCTEKGLTAGVKCSVCGEILTAQQEILANGHKYESVVTAPTCTEQGYTTYTCACGDSYVDDYIDSLGHDFENGTCTECSATDPDYFRFSIQEPSTKRIRCTDGIVLHTNIVGTLPRDARIEWTSSNNNFSVDKSNSGDEITIISKNNGYTTFTATVYDADNNVIAQDTIEMYSKASFFDKIGGFFRGLFGLTTIYEN